MVIWWLGSVKNGAVSSQRPQKGIEIQAFPLVKEGQGVPICNEIPCGLQPVACARVLDRTSS